ncbi:MAG TPA: hypothetical protein VM925_04495 [Labilithrix sp.]|nr:hypothetical protein [Labilithrix sp.]
MNSSWKTIARFWIVHRAAISLVLFSALVVKVLGGVLAAIDLGVADEAVYLARGTQLGKEPLPPAESSPLYSVWYRALAVFQPDPARLYYVNWIILQGGLALALYALARRSGASLGAALLVTTTLVLSQTPFVWPYVTCFSTLLLACTALIATYAKDRFVAAVILSVGVTTAAFVRPELWWPSILFATACVLWAIRRATSTRAFRPIAVVAPAVLAVAGQRAIFGNPVGGDRGLYAFAQHYALNKVEDGDLPTDPWASYEALFRPAFPHAQRLSEALRENPAEVLWHVRRNLRLIPLHLADVGGIHEYVPLVPRTVLMCALVAVIVIGAVGLVRARRRPLEGLVRWLPLGLPIGIGAITSSVIVYPREHYLVPLQFFGLAALAAGTAELAARAPAFVRAAVPAFVALGLVLLPTYGPTVFPSLLEARRSPPPQVNKHVVETLRSLGLRRKGVLVESGWSRGLYASLDFEHVPDAAKDAPFWSFVEARHIDVLVLDRFVRDNPRFRDDPEFAAFMADASERRDFVLVPVPGEDAFVAVRRSAARTASVSPSSHSLDRN